MEEFEINECHDLYLTIAKFVLPRLTYFASTAKSVPDRMNAEEWQLKLGTMVKAFELIVADGVTTPEEKQLIERGLKEFNRHFFSLWY